MFFCKPIFQKKKKKKKGGTRRTWYEACFRKLFRRRGHFRSIQARHLLDLFRSLLCLDLDVEKNQLGKIVHGASAYVITRVPRWVGYLATRCSAVYHVVE